MERGLLTARGLDRVLRVAWTVADLAGHDRPDGDGRRPGPAAAHRGRRAGRSRGMAASGRLGVSAGSEPGPGPATARSGSPGPPSPGSSSPATRSVGRWLRGVGAGEVLRRAAPGTGAPLPGVSGEAAGPGCAPRAGAARPRARTWRPSPRRGGAVRLPRGRASGPVSSTTSGTPGPIGLWVRGRPVLRMWALRSVAVVGARACTRVRRARGGHPRRRARRAGLGGGLRRRPTGSTAPPTAGRSRAGGATVGGAGLRGGRRLSARAHRVDRAHRGTGAGHRRSCRPATIRRRSRFVLRNRVIAALTRGTVVVEAALPQRLAGHRARARSGSGRSHDGGARARSPAGSPPGCTNCCAARPSWSPTPPKSSNWSATSGSWPRTGAGPCSPRDLLDPRAGTGAGRAAGARRASARSEIARGARHRRRTTRSAGCTNCRSLGFVERHGDGWQLTRQAMHAGPRRRGGP